jgi:GMP synthase-like glutamine amidotransferase
MHIGILRTDSVSREWVSTYGEYPDMFTRLLSAEDDALTFTTWNVEVGELPHSVEAADGFLITGSKSSVYDDKAWIRALEDFVRECHAARRKVIGICFGHQLVAQALGGVVAKSPKGWGVGVHCYTVDREGFDLADGEQFCLLASHQDQVMTMPPGATKIASNDHCEFAGMTLGQHLLTFQGHPEFIPAYSREIMTFRRDMIGAERVAEGIASLEEREHEGSRIARWMLAFLRR